jgi:hypothetical protein
MTTKTLIELSDTLGVARLCAALSAAGLTLQHRDGDVPLLIDSIERMSMLTNKAAQEIRKARGPNFKEMREEYERKCDELGIEY